MPPESEVLRRTKNGGRKQGKITGILVCTLAISSLGSPVMILQVGSHSSVDGSFQPSQSPANTNG
jgi:hypothetical protein